MNARMSILTSLFLAVIVGAGVFAVTRWGGTVAPPPVVATSPAPVAPPTEAPTTSPTASTNGAPASPLAQPASPTVYDYTVVNTYPHDPAAFTQGLVYRDGLFYEGTGLYGESSLRQVEPATGRVLQQHNLDATLFGEGIAVLGEQIYQLTWKNGVAFLYDRTTIQEKGQFTYATEGWGLTHDGQQLIMSDGTPVIYFRDPATFEETRRITVTVEGAPVPQLNELEYVEGKILANVWQTDYMLRIDPATGVVDGIYDFTGLLAQAPPSTSSAAPDVLNGVAYDSATQRLFVTGKRWPALFEVEMHPRQ